MRRERRGKKRSEEKSVRRGKAKGERKKQRPREATKNGCLTSADETIRSSKCFGKRACGARVGVSSAANK